MLSGFLMDTSLGKETADIETNGCRFGTRSTLTSKPPIIPITQDALQAGHLIATATLVLSESSSALLGFQLC